MLRLGAVDNSGLGLQAKLDMPLGMAARTRMRLIVVVITTLTWLFVGSIAFVHLEVRTTAC